MAWRYHPEFMIRILINGSPAGKAVQVKPSPACEQVLKSYGLLIRSVTGGAMAYVRQKPSGVNWIPAVNLTQPVKFSFWMSARQGTDLTTLDFFKQGTQRFGRQILYTNNLSAAGAIDTNLAGSMVSLTAASTASATERGALSNYILSTEIVPGDYTMIRAGRINAGAPVSFSISNPITALQSSVALDVRQLDKGAYVVRLDGPTPVQERVFFDQQAAGSEVNGVIDIHKTAWQILPQPREYRINFSST